MAFVAAYPIPGPWTNQDLVLYHGTSDADWPDPLNDPVGIPNVTKRQDFGRGFYTTTNFAQAESWAFRRSELHRRQRRGSSSPLVLMFTVPRNKLAGLYSMWFVRGDSDAEDYWSMVHHCRSGGDHGINGKRQWYDLLAGPLASSWQSRLTFMSADQISFHTKNAVTILNNMSMRQVV
jgi:hypothetical protein